MQTWKWLALLGMRSQGLLSLQRRDIRLPGNNTTLFLRATMLPLLFQYDVSNSARQEVNTLLSPTKSMPNIAEATDLLVMLGELQWR